MPEKSVQFFESSITWADDSVMERASDEYRGRTLDVRVIPYNTVGHPTPRSLERFAPGSMTKTARERAETVPLTLGHVSTGGQLIGRSLGFTDRPDGLYGRFLVSETSVGKDVMTLVKDRALSAGSVGFIPHRTGTFTQDRRQGVEVREASLDHFTLLPTGIPAYGDSTVLAVRHQLDDDEERRLRLLWIERERNWLTRNI